MFSFLVTQSLKSRLLVLAFAGVLMLYGAFRDRACRWMCCRTSTSRP